ncbi:hypothetical protein O3M35_004945 [Rhynocoris fuscipes]|uniref:C2H2-type domain-containing protein n=1 Tax=Rhynocoris fuscipes TaxID=488301 RepID=A0AAW1DGR6_9HEMI
MQLKGNSDSSIHAHSTGEESNSSDTALSERGLSISGNGPHSISDLTQPKSEPPDYLGPPDHHNSSGMMDPSRNPNFPAALLGLQDDDEVTGYVCPLCASSFPDLHTIRSHIDRHYPRDSPACPVPSCGRLFSHPNSVRNHMTRRGLDMMRVRATDPRPCPKCGKIYRSAHTLRTHLEDKHTVCPGYRCVLCGTVAKSRNSLHSHMSRQHRGISTKDLPVLPMPSPFDPELASRLLAKAGVKVSAAELRARSSPTGPPRRPDIRLELKSSDDPEDLTVHNNHSTPAARYCSVDIRPLTPPHMPPGSRHPLASPPPPGPPHHLLNNKDSRGPSTGSAILDTYLQFIAENSANLHLSAEQAAKVAARVSEEQRRLAAMDDRVTTVDESSGAEDEDEFSEEEREPEPIKAE